MPNLPTMVQTQPAMGGLVPQPPAPQPPGGSMPPQGAMPPQFRGGGRPPMPIPGGAPMGRSPRMGDPLAGRGQRQMPGRPGIPGGMGGLRPSVPTMPGGAPAPASGGNWQQNLAATQNPMQQQAGQMPPTPPGQLQPAPQMSAGMNQVTDALMQSQGQPTTAPQQQAQLQSWGR